MPYAKVQPVIDLTVRGLCVRSYPNHRHGCPCYARKPGCPPHSPTIHDLILLSEPVYVICNVFDFAAHCKRMRDNHPAWSDRQVACCLYWQPRARNQLLAEVQKFMAAPDHRNLTR